MEKVIKSSIAIGITGIILTSSYLAYSNFKSPTQVSISRPPLRASSASNPAIASLLNEAQVLKEARQYDQSVQKYVQAFELDKSSNLALIGIASVYFELDKQEFVLKNLQNAEQKGSLNYEGKILLLKSAIFNQNIPAARNAFDSIAENTNEKLLLGSLINILANEVEEAENKLKNIATNNISDSYFILAQKLISSIDLYKTFIDSPHSYLLATSAKTLLDGDQFILARPLLFASIEKENDYRDAWLMLGYSYLLVNKNDDAIKSLNRAKQIDPYNPEVFFYLGLAEKKLNKTESSLENFQKASSFGFRNSKDNLVQIANSFYLEKRYEDAIDFYTRAQNEGTLKLDDYTKVVWINIEHLDQPQEALNAALIALENYSSTPMANNLAGWANIALGNLQEAEKFLQIALQIDPNFDPAYLNLGLLAKTQDQPEKAIENFNKAIQLANQNRSPSIAERAKSEIEKINNSN
jgi:tetratricopeptide (TPR) repeat protein